MKLITVHTIGGKRRLNRDDYIERWVNAARELRYLGIDIVEDVATRAGADFDAKAEEITHV